MDKAIAQSGTSLCSWSLLNYVGTYTRGLATYMNCPVSNSTELVECLRGKDAKEMVMYLNKIEVRARLVEYIMQITKICSS